MATIAFDFDGTLLDSRNRHIVVMRDVLKKNNIDINIDDLIDFKSDGKNNVDYLIGRGIDEEIAKQIQKQWVKDIENEKYLDLDVLYDDAIDLLNKYSSGNDLVLVTARANTDGVYNQIDKFGLRKYFKEIFIVEPGKKASDLKADILKSQHAILMIGDTKSDYMAAKKAGTDFIFHENGFHNKQTTMGE